MSPELQAWADAGRYLYTPIGQHRVFFKQLGDPEAPPDRTLLLLHGFPESSYSFHKVVSPLLARFDRIVLFDFIGYGLSDKPAHYGYSLYEQADVALEVWRALGVQGGHLLAHDMGTSVATELLARELSALLPAGFSEGFNSVTFTNGSMVLALARLRLTQRLLLSPLGPLLARWSSYRVMASQVRSAHGNDGLSDADLEHLWENIQLGDGHRNHHRVIRYLLDRRRLEAPRWLEALRHTRTPIHLCWGTDDAVARVEMAYYLKEKVCPQAQLSLMPGVGHFGQLSDPERWVETVIGFYRQSGAA
ncbi:alpha/beta fold hydrolase [Aestuariirhabdus litorea]|uniref:Alpha/beta hydrolase n=1 Tax=Aestuariirhabdus litorea TaxID=2528527 RepID=A0A3P3VNN9_9GAMM|nr:alpha/beta hydrolase [Aestuariirhabdus litorea]RRJ83957.1 alpha/beta hydrolase [Aestuariirhabdus litorea]RWW97177.1 alpha/beta fold hydrolase [Endozoicomonadaceae bacterium GTF-13]